MAKKYRVIWWNKIKGIVHKIYEKYCLRISDYKRLHLSTFCLAQFERYVKRHCLILFVRYKEVLFCNVTVLFGIFVLSVCCKWTQPTTPTSEGTVTRSGWLG